MFSGILEKWHCSFDELISKHTTGQVALLSSGAALWNDLVQEATEKHEKSGSSNKSKAKHVMPEWAKESAENYNRWMESIGMGSSIVRGM